MLAGLLAAHAATATHAAGAGAGVARLLGSMSSFQSEFEQTVLNSFGDVLQVATGTMHLQRPGRLRWEVREPFPQLVLADGDVLWVHDPDLDQVSVQPLSVAIEGSPAVFLTGGDAVDLEADFAVSEIEPATADDALRFVLQPRDTTSVFRDLSLSFSAAGVLTGIDIVDHLDQITRVVFVEAEVNPRLAPELFEFEIPPGTDVIGDVPSSAAAAR